MKCKHDQAKTPFCPECGQALQALPHVSLRAYLKQHVDGAARDLAQRRRDHEVNENWPWVARGVQTLQKWQSWLTFVEEAIEKNDG